MILRVDGELFFANARWFRETVRSLVRDQTPPVRELLVHVGAVPRMDTTAATMLKELIAELHETGVELAFARATTGLVHDLERNGIMELVGEDRFYDTVAAGVDDFLRRTRPARASPRSAAASASLGGLGALAAPGAASSPPSPLSSRNDARIVSSSGRRASHSSPEQWWYTWYMVIGPSAHTTQAWSPPKKPGRTPSQRYSKASAGSGPSVVSRVSRNSKPGICALARVCGMNSWISVHICAGLLVG